MTMFEIVILASALLLIIRAIYLYYKPSIDIIVIVELDLIPIPMTIPFASIAI